MIESTNIIKIEKFIWKSSENWLSNDYLTCKIRWISREQVCRSSSMQLKYCCQFSICCSQHLFIRIVLQHSSHRPNVTTFVKMKPNGNRHRRHLCVANFMLIRRFSSSCETCYNLSLLLQHKKRFSIYLWKKFLLIR